MTQAKELTTICQNAIGQTHTSGNVDNEIFFNIEMITKMADSKTLSLGFLIEV